MKYKKFGRTGKQVSVLGLGGMRFDPKAEALALEAILTAVELGISYIDTAPGYCEDKSEEFTGKALASLLPGKRKNVFISTKSSIHSDPDADAVRKRIENQLKRLNKEKIEFFKRIP